MASATSGSVQFIRSTQHVTLALCLARGVQPISSSILKNYDDIVTDQGSELLLPAGYSDVDRVAWVVANKFGSGGMGMGLLARVVKMADVMCDDHLETWVGDLGERIIQALVSLKAITAASAGAGDKHERAAYDSVKSMHEAQLRVAARELSAIPMPLLQGMMATVLERVGSLNRLVALTPKELHPLLLLGARDLDAVVLPPRECPDFSSCAREAHSRAPDAPPQYLAMSFLPSRSSPHGFHPDGCTLRQAFSSCAQLTSLRIEGSMGALADLHQSCVLTQLQALHIRNCSTAPGAVRELMRVILTVASTLQSLSLAFDDPSDPGTGCDAGHRALTAVNACTALTSLRLRITCTLEHQQQAVTLPRLVHLDLGVDLYSTSLFGGAAAVGHPLPVLLSCPELLSLELRLGTQHLSTQHCTLVPAVETARGAKHPMFPKAKSLVIHRIEWPGDPAGLPALEALLKHTPSLETLEVGSRLNPGSAVYSLDAVLRAAAPCRATLQKLSLPCLPSTPEHGVGAQATADSCIMHEPGPMPVFYILREITAPLLGPLQLDQAQDILETLQRSAPDLNSWRASLTPGGVWAWSDEDLMGCSAGVFATPAGWYDPGSSEAAPEAPWMHDANGEDVWDGVLYFDSAVPLEVMLKYQGPWGSNRIEGPVVLDGEGPWGPEGLGGPEGVPVGDEGGSWGSPDTDDASDSEAEVVMGAADVAEVNRGKRGRRDFCGVMRPEGGCGDASGEEENEHTAGTRSKRRRIWVPEGSFSDSSDEDEDEAPGRKFRKSSRIVGGRGRVAF